VERTAVGGEPPLHTRMLKACGFIVVAGFEGSPDQSRALRGMKWQAVARDRGVAKFCTLAPYGLGKVLLALGLRPKSRRTLSKIFALLVPRVVHWPDPFTPGGRADRSPGRVFEAGSDEVFW
jgi:hypothetical protein